MDIVHPRSIVYFFKPYFLYHANYMALSSFIGWDYNEGKMVPIEKVLELLSTQTGNTQIETYMPKPVGEVLVHGSAITPKEKPVEQMLVGLQLLQSDQAVLSKKMLVSGDRYWKLTDDKTWEISQPEPFTKFPLGSMYAFGGTGLIKEGEEVARSCCEQNLIGKGFDAKNKAKYNYAVLESKHAHSGTGIIDQKELQVNLPNLEKTDDQIHHIDDHIAPISFGSFQPHAPFRQKHFGTVNDQWKKNAIRLPKDFNPLFFNMAQEDQQIDGYFSNDTKIRIEGMHAEGLVEFDLPKYRVRHFSIQKKENTKQTDIIEESVNLDTLHVFPNQKIVLMAYRSSVEMKQVDFNKQFKAMMMAYENLDDSPRDVQYYADHYEKIDSPGGGLLLLDNHKLMPKRSKAELLAIKEDQSQKDQKMIQEQQDLIDKRLDHTAGMMNMTSKELLQAVSPKGYKIDPKSHAGQLAGEMQKAMGVSIENPFDIKSMSHLLVRAPTKKELLEGTFDLGAFSSKLNAITARSKSATDQISEVFKNMKKDLEKEHGMTLSQEAKKVPERYLEYRSEVMFDAETLPIHCDPNPTADNNIPKEMQSSSGAFEGLYILNQCSNISPLLIEEDAKHLGQLLMDRAQEKRNLSRLNGSGAIFSDQTFSNVMLIYSFIENALFKNMIFEHCNFQNAVLRGSNFVDCHFKKCIFSLANISQANFTNTKFKNCLFDQTIATTVKAKDTQFINCTLKRMQIQMADWDHMTFKNTLLNEINIVDAKITNSSFAESEIKRTHMIKCNLDNGFFSHLHVKNLGLFDVQAKQSFWNNSEFEYLMANHENNDFSYSSFSKITAKKSTFSKSNLTHCDFSYASVKSTLFDQCNLSYAYMHKSALQEADFSFAVFEGIDLSYSNLYQANFKEVEFIQSTLDHSTFYGANLAFATFDKQTAMEDVDWRNVINQAQKDEDAQSNSEGI